MDILMGENQKDFAMWQQKWPAPAKLNLMLRIVGRREDGYHLLQTVFQFIDLCDWLRFYQVDDDSVYLKNPIPGVPETSDLTIRAANLLKLESGCKQGVCIEVEKNLPMGGGLGGGSSDAATVLSVLNKLWQINFSTEKLMQIGLKLGADVPVFVHGYASWAEGIGEKLEKITIPEQWFVIVKPDCHVNTKEVFSAKDLTRDSKPITIAGFMAGQHQNDCLAIVSKSYQPVKEAMTELSNIGKARLTGTGACVFAQFDCKDQADRAYHALQNNWQVYKVKGINKSPLLTMLENF